MRNPDLLGSWVRRFLLEYLVGERNFAENTRRSYRDTLALAIPFVATAAGTSVDRLLVSDVAADRIRQFLGHVEQARSCRITTRNQRLAALHSLARFIGGRSPEHLAWCSEVCSIPFKKAPHEGVCYLEKPEMEALLDAPDRRTRQGFRDHTVLLFLYSSGARASEAAGVTVVDFLQYLETDRHNLVATRNVRLAAIHAFFRYCAAEDPAGARRSRRSDSTR